MPPVFTYPEKAWSLEDRKSPDEKARYVAAQKDAVLRAVAEYHPDVPLVFGVDFGHIRW